MMDYQLNWYLLTNQRAKNHFNQLYENKPGRLATWLARLGNIMVKVGQRLQSDGYPTYNESVTETNL